MTLQRLLVLLAVALAVGSVSGFVATGSLVLALGLLVAPVPLLAALMLDLRGSSMDAPARPRTAADALSDDLDRALRAPVPTPGARDDGSLFVPGVPALRPRDRAAPPPPPLAAPVSTPVR